MNESTNQPKEGRSFTPSGFFALRTPLLPFDELLAWSEGLEAPAAGPDAARLEPALVADRVRLRERLRQLVGRPEIREALFVASPSLEERLAVWSRDPDSEPGQKVERAVIRYFVRMAGRPTPFGLFAGCSVGTLGAQARIALASRVAWRRHTRLDMDYLFDLAAQLERDPNIRKALRYRPNSSLYTAAGRLRYAEARLANKVRSHHLVAVEPNDYLAATLERARAGARPADLAAALVSSDPDISLAEAEGFVSELIASQILVSDLAPAVTGPEPIHGLLAVLREIPEATEAAGRLEEVRAALEAIDHDPLGVPPQRYRAVAALLETLPAEVELARLFQVDMVKPVTEAALSPAVISELVRGVEILHRLAPPGQQDRWTRFRSAFAERYGDREVPLVEVLDEEVGIGFERSSAPTAEASPLLAGLLFPGTASDDGLRWRAREGHLLRKYEEAVSAGATEITLTAKDLERLAGQDVPPLPDAFAVMATVAAASEVALAQGDFRILIRNVAGPSGAILLGRFCHADDALRRAVDQHLRAEELLQPDAVLAEIVHLPEGRIGNILLRPALREYEIPFLGVSGASPAQQVPVDDLLVAVVGERVILRSRRLGREVLPRLTSAHNYTLRSLGVYRFLCALQQQGVAGALGWNWGALESAQFLPRVGTGRLVFARARWRVGRNELEVLAKVHGVAQFQAVQAWRGRRKLPRFVSLADADNELDIDLDNVLSMETFVNLVKDRIQIRLVETYPGPDQLCVRGPEGPFAHELVVPFVRTRTPTPRTPTPQPSVSLWEQRVFPPGSEWLYAKLYTGTSTADRLLRDVLGPLAREAARTGLADRWFFVRYSDPEWHLRVRWHGARQTLQSDVLPRLQEALRPMLAHGWVSRFQLDTYEREVERYGGVEGMTLAEQLFYVDSEAALAIIELLAGDEGADARWRLALRGMDVLLSDLGLDLNARWVVIKQARAAFGAEFRAETTGLKHQLGGKFRKERKALEGLLDPANDADSPLQPGFLVLQRRSEQLAPLVAELKACETAGRLSRPLTELAGSYIHMHANRMLRSAQRAQELVLYDFLSRLYESRAARGRAKT